MINRIYRYISIIEDYSLHYPSLDDRYCPCVILLSLSSFIFPVVTHRSRIGVDRSTIILIIIRIRTITKSTLHNLTIRASKTVQSLHTIIINITIPLTFIQLACRILPNSLQHTRDNWWSTVRRIERGAIIIRITLGRTNAPNYRLTTGTLQTPEARDAVRIGIAIPRAVVEEAGGVFADRFEFPRVRSRKT